MTMTLKRLLAMMLNKQEQTQQVQKLLQLKELITQLQQQGKV